MGKRFKLSVGHPAQGSAKVRRWLRRFEKKMHEKMNRPAFQDIMQRAYVDMACFGEARIYEDDLIKALK